MKIKTKDLIEALNRLKKITLKKPVFPILSCVKMRAENDTLEVEATDLDQYQMEKVECSGKLPECCIDFGKLSAMLSGETTTIEIKGKSAVIKSGYAVAEIQMLEPEEYPKRMEAEGNGNIGVSGVDVAKAVRQVSWAASTEIARYVLQSVHIVGKTKSLTAESTNGRNLALVSIPAICSEFDLLIPSSTAENFSTALERQGSKLLAGKNMATVVYDDGFYTTKLIDGVYPSTNAVIPKTPELIGEVLREELAGEFGRCNFYADPTKTPKAIMEFSADGLEIHFTGKDNSQIEISIPGKFKKHQAKMSADSFFKCLSSIESDKIQILKGGKENMAMLILKSENLSVYTTEVRE